VTVQFTAAATDADGDTLDYLWDFIDGTKSSLQNPTHIFTTEGVHTVILTVVDHHGGQVSTSVTVDVLGSSALGLDSDNDGYADEIEVALGSNLQDAASTPLNQPVISRRASIASPRLTINLSFVSIYNDSIVLSGFLPLPDAFAPASQTVIVDVGGAVDSFKLQTTGKSAKNTVSSAFIYKKPYRKTPTSPLRNFVLIMKKGNFSAALANHGLTDLPAQSVQLIVPVSIIINGTLYAAQAPVVYSTIDFQKSVGTPP